MPEIPAPKIPDGYRRLDKSERHAASGAHRVGPANPAETLTVSIRVRRRPDAPPLPDPAVLAATPLGQRQYLSREDFAARYGADPKDLALVADFARSHGLKVVETSIPRRMVVASGTVAQMNSAFGVDLGTYQSPTQTYRGREGYLSVPSNLADIVEGVFGLDNRQMARPLIAHAKVPAAAGGAQATVTLTPPVVAGLYGFPASPKASGQTIGILEFGGGYLTTDIEAFFSNLNLTAPTIVSVSVDGATNSPGTSGSDEVTMDIDVAGSVAQGARLAVYFAPWSEQGWVDSVTTAIHDATNKPSVLSISWGWPEFETISGLTWSNAAINAVSQTFQDAATLGVTIFVASGDSGSGCGVADGKAHVLYPASDPGVTSCGGTTISNVSGSSFTQSTWTSTGGGISDFFPLPYWQNFANIPASVNDGHKGRGIPDVAGNADPNSGYQVVLDGVSGIGFGGTSAVAPMYAGLVALIEAALGPPLGYLNPNIYAFSGPYVYVDVNDGASNASGGALGYASGPGWDACTGFGSIVGNAMEAALTGVGLPPAMAVFNGSLYLVYKSVEFDDRIFSTSFNGTAWTPPQQVSTVGTSSGVSLAVFNGKLYMAWKGMQADQAIYWSVFDGVSWAAQQQTPGFGTSTGPSLAVFNNALYMAWKGIQSDQRVFWSSFNGVWANQQAVPGIGTSVGPSLAVFNGRLYTAWKGEFGDERLFYSYFDGTSWTSQQLIPGTSSEGASLAVFDNALYAAWKGVVGNQNISWSRFNGSVWAPQQSVLDGDTSVGPSIAAFNSLLYMVWKGPSGDQQIIYSSFNGTAWAAQKLAPGIGTSPDLVKKKNVGA
jgi:hypothetical protein